MLQRTGLPAGVVSCRERPPTRGNSPLQTVGSPTSLSPANTLNCLLLSRKVFHSGASPRGIHLFGVQFSVYAREFSVSRTGLRRPGHQGGIREAVVVIQSVRRLAREPR